MKTFKTLTSRLQLTVLIAQVVLTGLALLTVLTVLMAALSVSANGNMHAVCVRVGNAFTISKHDVRKAFRRVNTRKVEGQDSISGQFFRACADQLALVFIHCTGIDSGGSRRGSITRLGSMVPQ